MNTSLRPSTRGPAPDLLQEIVATLRGRRVVVVGLGKSGKMAAELLVAMGAASVDALDDRPADRLAGDVAEMARFGNVRVRGGGIDAELASRAELVVVSPGVPRRGAWWDAIEAARTPWMGEAELAWRTTTAPWLCVTGTNGKSTTTTWLGTVLRPSHW